jgi:hypothetical protein
MSGRPRVTTAAQDRYIRLRHLRERFTTATSTALTIPGVRRISDQIVRNCLRDAGIRARRPVRAATLSKQTPMGTDTQRVAPAVMVNSLFSDEPRFLLQRRW